MSKFLYKNGLPFTTKLATSVDKAKKRIRLKKASMIIIDGAQGEGKTTLAVEVAEYYQGSNLVFSDQYAMGGHQFTIKLRICIRNNRIVIIYDEAGDFSKRGFLTAFNKTLNRIFETFRTFEILIIVVLPNFRDLDPGLFEKGIPRILIHCFGRNESYGKFKVYGLWRMSYLRAKMADRRVACKGEAYKFVRANFQGRFKDLSPKKSKMLDRISTQGKSDVLQEINIKNNHLMDYKAIADQVEKSVDWVKRKISKLQLKEELIYQRKKYFSKSVVQKLRAEIR